MQRVFNLSGGRSSAMATLVSNPTSDDIILFTDTGREHPLTYKFIEDFEKYEGLKVHTAAYQSLKHPELLGFDALVRHENYLPNKVQRMCTKNLKIGTAKKYLRSIGINPKTKIQQFIGFRADEEHRVNGFRPTWKNVETKFPLYELGVNKAMVLDFWSKKPYDLQVPSILGNCDLCFLKGKAAIIRILEHFPELAEKWIADEQYVANARNTKKGRFISDVSYTQLLAAAQRQGNLFEKKPLDDISPAYGCACTNF